jgi:putative toxin-antitoxin system antitoxin component (TIGR02293 family)
MLRLDEADAVARLVRVRSHAERVFDDAALAQRWLSSPNPELGNETPIEMARTDVGAGEVEAVLLRMKHGVVG